MKIIINCLPVIMYFIVLSSTWNIVFPLELVFPLILLRFYNAVNPTLQISLPLFLLLRHKHVIDPLVSFFIVLFQEVIDLHLLNFQSFLNLLLHYLAVIFFELFEFRRRPISNRNLSQHL